MPPAQQSGDLMNGYDNQSKTRTLPVIPIELQVERAIN